jgi:hypothetical protein
MRTECKTPYCTNGTVRKRCAECRRRSDDRLRDVLFGGRDYSDDIQHTTEHYNELVRPQQATIDFDHYDCPVVVWHDNEEYEVVETDDGLEIVHRE